MYSRSIQIHSFASFVGYSFNYLFTTFTGVCCSSQGVQNNLQNMNETYGQLQDKETGLSKKLEELRNSKVNNLDIQFQC